jgi:hypothetical protein
MLLTMINRISAFTMQFSAVPKKREKYVHDIIYAMTAVIMSAVLKNAENSI